MEKLKRCSKCREFKLYSEFHNNKNNKDGLAYDCKKCHSLRRKEYYQKNKLKAKKQNEIYKNNDIQKYRKMHQIADKKWYLNNRKKKLRKLKEWQEKNKEKRKKYSLQYQKKRWKSDIQYRLRSNVTRKVNTALKRRLSFKKGKSTFDFLPYTIDELKSHLENQFIGDKSWMNWDNYGGGKGKWSIDHIKPDSSFNYKAVEDEEFQRCWTLNNLQPLDSIENSKKGNRF